MSKKFLYVIVGLLILVTVVAAVPPALRERIAIYAKDDSWIVNGFDIIWYSNDRVTETARIDGATGNFTTSGSLTPTGGLDLNGKTLTIDADADTTLIASTDDLITTTLGAGTGRFDIKTGNLRVGNGSPTVSQDGEDAYVEGQFEVDGEAQFDGAVDANSTSDFADTVTLSKGSGNAIVVSSGGAIDANGASDFADTATFSKGSGNAVVVSAGGAIADAGTLNVDGAVTLNSTLDVDGNITSGTGAITMTDNATITGTLNADGAVTLNSTLDVDGNISSGTGAITMTDSVVVDGGLVDVGLGSYTLADGNNDLGVAGDFEVDGASNLDGNVTLGGTLTLESIVFSGPTVFGVATNIANNGTIAHGMATTPTIAIVMPLTTTATITNVPYVKSLDATNITVVVPSGVVTTFDKLMWIAGK